MFILRWLIVPMLCSVAVAALSELDREIVLAPQPGETREDVEIARWQERARTSAAPDLGIWERLGWAYVAKARRTQDAGFYKLAQKTVDVMAAQFGAIAQVEFLRAHVLHNLHRFRDAEQLAQHLVVTRGEPLDFALLSDTLVEQGKLVPAIAALQRMAELRPGTEALSRIAHIRWLKGDLAGAISAMAEALSASAPHDVETGAWLRARLSGYHLQAGDAAAALVLADAACVAAPDYPPALLVRGQALCAQGNYAAAAVALQTAAELNPLPNYQWWLADVLRQLGRDGEATRVEAKLLARGAATDPRSLALFLATRGVDAPRSLKIAQAELAIRADPLTYDAVAWAEFASGELDAAANAIRAALAENTQDARLFSHAAEIAFARGEREDAARYFASARHAAGTLTPSERARLEQRSADVLDEHFFTPTNHIDQ